MYSIGSLIRISIGYQSPYNGYRTGHSRILDECAVFDSAVPVWLSGRKEARGEVLWVI